MKAVIGATNNYGKQTSEKVTFDVTKGEWKVTPPTAVADLSYTGEPLALIYQGNVEDGGTLQYSVDVDDSYGTEIDYYSATDAGKHNVYYKVEEDKNHVAYECDEPVEVNIARIAWDFEPPTAVTGLVYDAKSHELIYPGNVEDGGILQYKIGESGTYGTDIESYSKIDAGDYYVYYMIEEDPNHNKYESSAEPVKATIKQADWDVTLPEPINPSITGEEQSLINPGEVRDVNGEIVEDKLLYSLEENEGYSTSIPTATEVGSYTVYCCIEEETNYKEFFDSVTATIEQGPRPDDKMPTVSMTGYTYGQEEVLPTPSITIPDDNPEITYYYNTIDSIVGAIKWENITSTSLAAGTYYMFAKLSATSSYREGYTSGTEFKIKRTKWNVTAPTALNSTYNKEEQSLVTPGEVRDVNGSLVENRMKYSLDDDGDYSTSIPTGDNAGKYYVNYMVEGDLNHEAFVSDASVEVTIAPAEWDVTEPTAVKGLIYSKEACALIAPGEVKDVDGSVVSDKLEYSLSKTEGYSTSTPTGIDAGTYYVYAKVEADTNHKKYESVTPVRATIAKANWSVKPPKAIDPYINGTEQQLISPGEIKDADGSIASTKKMLYKTKETDKYKEDIPTAIEVGEYTVYYMVAGDDNHNNYTGTVLATIQKGPRPESDMPTAGMTGYTYGQEEELPSPSISRIPTDEPQITYYYNTTDSYDDAIKWEGITSTTLDAGDYYMFAELAATDSYGKGRTGRIPFTIAKASWKVTKPEALSLTYNKTEQSLVATGVVKDVDGSDVSDKLQYSLSATDGYSEAIPTAENAGTYQVYYKVNEDTNHNVYECANPVAVTIAKADWTVTPPEPINPSTTGEAQELVAPGVIRDVDGSVVTDNKMLYSLTGTDDYSETISTAIAVGEYTVYYKVEGDDNHNARTGYVTAAIEMGPRPAEDMPTVSMAGYKYGRTEALPTPSISEVPEDEPAITYYYSSTVNFEDAKKWENITSTTLDVGTYYMFAALGATSSYGHGHTTGIPFEITKADWTVTSPSAVTGLIYNGDSQVLINLGSTQEGATMKYRIGENGSYGTEESFYSETNAGTYDIYYMVDEDKNHNEYVSASSITATIAKANWSVTAPTDKALSYSGETRALINPGEVKDVFGNVVDNIMLYKVGETEYSTSIPTATEEGNYTVYYKVAGNDNYNEYAAKTLTATIKTSSPTPTPTPTPTPSPTPTPTPSPQKTSKPTVKWFSEWLDSLKKKNKDSESKSDSQASEQSNSQSNGGQQAPATPTSSVSQNVQLTETGRPIQNYFSNNPTKGGAPLPYIMVDGLKSGWNMMDVSLDIYKAKYKKNAVEPLCITLNGNATVDTKFIMDAHEKKIPLSFILDDGVIIGIPAANSVLSDRAKKGKNTFFSASSMTTAEAVSVNKTHAGLLPSDIIAIGGNGNTPVVLTLISNDKLSLFKSQQMTITFNALQAGFKKGDKVYLYCGTMTTGIAMYKKGKVDKNGLVTFSVPMVSNYWTIGSKNLKNTLLRNTP